MTKAILVFGDSNSHGTPPMETVLSDGRFAKPDRWPEVMAAALGDVDLVVDGLPGRTTVFDDPIDGGQRNGAAVILSAVHAHKPLDLLVIMLGTNDLKARFSVNANEIARGVARLVRMVQAEGVVRDVMIVSPPPVREVGIARGDFAGAKARGAGLAEALADWAQRLGVGFFDAGSVVSVSDVDGIHLDKAAHATLGAAMADAVKGRLA